MTATTGTAALEIPEGFRNTWTDIFRSDTLIHLCLMVSIVTGAFQGWLKDRMGGALPYALSDGAFVAAVFLWVATAAVYRRPLLRSPRGTSMDLIVLAVIIAPALYLLAPDTPFLIKVAGLRAWSLFPIGCLIGMSVIRTPGQVRAYVGVIIIVCLITGLYGINQYIKGPQEALATALGQERHGSTVFYDITGTTTTDFRAFSTFTYPAPFAGMMVFGILLAAGVLFARARPALQRIAAALVIPVLFVAMTVSGTRAALVTLLVGLLVLGWLRGLSFAQLLLIPTLLIGLHVATILTSGRIVARYQSLLLHEGETWMYISNPIRTAIQSLASQPFGLGLGRTGTGVPFAIVSRMPLNYFVFTDGDIGRAAVELGLIGLVVLGFIVFGLLPRMMTAARALVRSDETDLALGIGGLVLSTGLVILIGSPLSTTPHAVIWWLLFGALVRLAMLRADRTPADSAEPDAPPAR